MQLTVLVQHSPIIVALISDKHQCSLKLGQQLLKYVHHLTCISNQWFLKEVTIRLFVLQQLQQSPPIKLLWDLFARRLYNAQVDAVGAEILTFGDKTAAYQAFAFQVQMKEPMHLLTTRLEPHLQISLVI